jgi:hypothetical protein
MSPARRKAAATRQSVRPLDRGAPRSRAGAESGTRAKPAVRAKATGRKPAQCAQPAARGARSFPQTAGASGRLAVLFELARARTSVLAAVQGLSPAGAERPLAGSESNLRQRVLQLAVRDRLVARELNAAFRAAPTTTTRDLDRASAADAAGWGHLNWDEALRLLHASRALMLETLEALPEGETEPWTTGHPLGAMLADVVRSDRDHADVIKQWRTDAGV